MGLIGRDLGDEVDRYLLQQPFPGRGTPHRASRPTWKCESCKHPWPCDARRAHLLADFDTNMVGLSCYLGTFAASMLADLGDSATVWKRLYGWLRTEVRGVPIVPVTVDSLVAGDIDDAIPPGLGELFPDR